MNTTYNKNVPLFSRLSLQVQTLYAQLVQELVSSDAARIVGGRSGVFVKKTIKGRVYWYVQYREQGKQHQKYLGAESPELLAFMQDVRAGAESRARICAMAVAGGAAPLGGELAVVRHLAEAGVFHLGAVVVGTQAFVVFGNMLGVRWRDGMLRTQDVDIAKDPRLTLAVRGREQRVDLPKTLESWGEARFLPVPPSPLDPHSPVTSFHEPRQGLKVELLTPLIGRKRNTPINLPSLNAAAQPLRFLDYLIEDPVPAAIVGGHGVLVNVPQPARYALHKLLIAGRRKDWEGKGRKDVAQADALCAVLLEDLPGSLVLAWEALVVRGRKWSAGVLGSLELISDETRDGLHEIGIG